LSRAQNRSKLKRRGQRRNRTHNRHHRIRLSTPKTMSTISHDQNAKRFATEVDGYRAELDYTLADSVMTITHTRVPQAIGGRGVAAELMCAALRVAETAGWSVNPACSYAAAYMRRHAQDPDKKHIDDLLDEALDESFPASDSPAVGGSS
jgi:predicted GNAT family acetyltransferase